MEAVQSKDTSTQPAVSTGMVEAEEVATAPVFGGPESVAAPAGETKEAGMPGTTPPAAVPPPPAPPAPPAAVPPPAAVELAPPADLPTDMVTTTDKEQAVEPEEPTALAADPSSPPASPAKSRASASPPRSSSSSNSPRRSCGKRSRSSSARSSVSRPQGRRSRTRAPQRDRTPARGWWDRYPNRKGGKGNGKSGGGKGGRRNSSASRGRSRTPARIGFNASRFERKGESCDLWQKGPRGRTVCWFGMTCKRQDCWFRHPEGRHIDGVTGSDQPRSPSRRRSPARRRSRARKASRSPVSSPSQARRPRRLARGSPSVTRNKRSASGARNKRSSPSLNRYKCPVASPSASAASSPSRSRAADATDQVPCPSTPPSSDTFRKFVWHCLDDAITPDQAVAKFAEHSRKLAEKDLEPLKGSGLLWDLYNPLALVRRHDLRVCTAQRNAQAFLQDVNNGRYSGLNLRSANVANKGVCPTAGHMVAPHFAFDPDADVLWLSGIPPAVSVWDIFDNLQSQPGFQAISMPHPQNGLLRDVRMRFSSPGYARAALNALANAQLKEGYKMRPALVDTAPTLEALVVPSEMSNPERIVKDAELCARVIQKLDALSGVRENDTSAVLAGPSGAKTEARLDLQLLYLRRVHHFCFYGCAWCDDEWDLRRRCGAACLRGGLSSGSSAPAEGAWSQAHQRRIESFLESAKLQRPSILTSDEEPLKSRLTGHYATKILQVTPAKFQCTLCRKFFKGPEYVNKHLRKVHVELVEAVRLQVQQEASWTGYLEDKNRPKGDSHRLKMLPVIG